MPTDDGGVKALLEALAHLRVENKILRARVQRLYDEHQNLFKVLIVILHEARERGLDEMRIHESQFKRFTEEYRIDQRFDKQTQDLVLKLMHIKDPWPISGVPKGD